MGLILRALVITLLMATGVAAGEGPGCKTVTNQDWGFSVCYPSDWLRGGVGPHVDNALFEDGEKVEKPNLFAFDTSSLDVIAMVEAHRSRPKTFEEFTNYYVEVSKKERQKMSGPKKINVNGLEGYEVTLEEGNVRRRTVVLYANGKGYRLTMWSGPEQGSHEKLAPVFEEFVKSFRLVK